MMVENFDKFFANLFHNVHTHRMGARYTIDRSVKSEIKLMWFVFQIKWLKAHQAFRFFSSSLWFLFAISQSNLMQKTLYYNYIKSFTSVYHMASYKKAQFNYVLTNHWFGFRNKFVNSSEQLVNNVIIFVIQQKLNGGDGGSNICNRKVSSTISPNPPSQYFFFTFFFHRHRHTLSRMIALLFSYLLHSPILLRFSNWKMW